jgi:acetyl-CoA synthetase
MADLGYDEEMGKALPDFDIVATSQYDPSLIHYTSGTTGKPKGVVHLHQALVQQYATGKWALDLNDDDIYWCTADPGWMTGTAYGMLAPWTNGVTQLVYEGSFRASAWYGLIQKHKVTVWYTAPTAIGMLMKAGDGLPRQYDMSSLRHVSSVGEHLDPETVVWGESVFGKPFHDSWWQTETGAILVANYPGMDVRPGSMGRPIPGVEVAVLDDDYEPVPTGNIGNLAVRPGWPSMFHTYWNDAQTYNSRFRKGWYITGDRARVDEDGYLWFAGRGDHQLNKHGDPPSSSERHTALIDRPAAITLGGYRLP